MQSNYISNILALTSRIWLYCISLLLYKLSLRNKFLNLLERINLIFFMLGYKINKFKGNYVSISYVFANYNDLGGRYFDF
ncbi:hypothetical protein BOM_0440 [Borrelia miyamotoi FR64b]|nr:hypothetical protein BOM_0440 [Borrelia miyamotoi FR64b]